MDVLAPNLQETYCVTVWWLGGEGYKDRIVEYLHDATPEEIDAVYYHYDRPFHKILIEARGI